MRLLIHDYPGHPFQVQLSRELARRGHLIIHTYAGYNQTPRGELNKISDDPTNFSIEPIFIRQPLQKYSFFRRWLQEREYGRLLADKIEAIKPDLVMSANTPLDAQAFALKRCQGLEIPFIFWLQDIIGIATYRLLKEKIPLLGSIIGQYYMHLERNLLWNSHRIVLISADFMPLMQQWGISSNKTTVIPNWATLSEIDPQPKSNPWSCERGLDGKFCFMYTGTLGMKHNPDLLLQLALHFRHEKDVHVVIVSEGPGAEWLLDKKTELNLENLSIYGFQPFMQLPIVLATADVLIAILEPDAGVYSVPSKVLTYLCARRSLLLAVPTENLAAKIVDQHKAGLVIDPKDVQSFLASADCLRREDRQREIFANNARIYAESHFKIQEIADKFEKYLLK
jgi:colanic acid biosynthesis glycosyl transferase WcaI